MINQCTDNNQANEIYWVADKIIANDFPDVTRALMEPDGLLAIGGDLDASRLLDAYQRGIFPWYNQGQPILWWSPDPRCILEPQQFHISHSLKKILRQEIFEVTCNQAFDQVIRHCAAPRKGTHGTWITEDIINAYTRLFELGHIMSIECWQHQQLVT